MFLGPTKGVEERLLVLVSLRSNSARCVLEVCQSFVAVLACWRAILIFSAISSAARVVWSSSLYVSTSAVLSSGSSIRVRRFFSACFLPAFCNFGSSSKAGSLSKARSITCYSACSCAMRAATTTCNLARKSMSSYGVPCRNKEPSSKDSVGISRSVKTSSSVILDDWPFSLWPGMTASVVSGATTKAIAVREDSGCGVVSCSIW